MLATLVWFLFLVTFNPCCSKAPAGGPFYSYNDCASVMYASQAALGSRYECDSKYQP